MAVQTEIQKLRLVAILRKIRNANSIIPRNFQWTLYIIGLVMSDAAMAFLSVWLAYYVRFEFLVRYFDANATISSETYRLLIYSTPFLWPLIFAI